MKIDVGGVKFNVTVGESDGIFRTEFAEEPVSSSSLKDLREELTKLIRQGRKKVEATLFGTRRYGEKDELEDIVVTGIHSRNRNVLIRHADGRASQVYRSTTILKSATKEDRAEFERIRDARDSANEAFDAWIEQHTLDVAKALEAEESER